MQNKIFKICDLRFMIFIAMLFSMPAIAEDIAPDTSADAVAAYSADGSVFQQITDMEQQKILLQLEKEKAQLDLDLIRLYAEIGELSGEAAQQQAELEAARQKLESDAAALERTKQNQGATTTAARTDTADNAAPAEPLSKKYELVDIVGVANKLQATVRDLASGQRKVVSVGKPFDDYTVKSISLADGIVFEKDGETTTLNVSRDN